MSGLQLIENNLHQVEVEGRSLLFHLPTSGLFELDGVGDELLRLFRSRPQVTAEDVRHHFDGRYPPGQVLDTLREFLSLDIINDGRPLRLERAPVAVNDFPLSTLVLNVNTGCNLSCTYCYKEDLATPSQGERMSFDTAVQGVELLLREGHQRERINLVFFGGEPLSNMPLIRRVVAYAEQRCAEEGKTVDFTLTTNATLLTESLIGYFNEHRFGLTVSMDGPKAIHDLRRRTVGGRGTYDVVARKVALLLEGYTARPVGARVTLTKGVTDVAAIHGHLVGELGFHEVGFSPVTAGDISDYNLSGAELAQVFANLKSLGQVYVEAALEGRNTGFSNLHQLLTDIHDGMSKALPCGAGVGLLAVDTAGGLNLCHRFTGSSLPPFGHVERGIDRAPLREFLENAARREDTPCETCHIRNLCAGGCYHESYARYHDPRHPNTHYCDLMRDWVDFGIAAYAKIQQENPDFFGQTLEPRRAYK